MGGGGGGGSIGITNSAELVSLMLNNDLLAQYSVLSALVCSRANV